QATPGKRPYSARRRRFLLCLDRLRRCEEPDLVCGALGLARIVDLPARGHGAVLRIELHLPAKPRLPDAMAHLAARSSHANREGGGRTPQPPQKGRGIRRGGLAASDAYAVAAIRVS